MPVIKISLPHLYFRLIYSFGDGTFLKLKQFPHALKKMMICSYLDCYKHFCIYIFTYVQINVTVHNTKRTFCSVTLLMCYCWCISNIPLLIILQKYAPKLHKLRLYQYKNISKSATSLNTFYYFSF